MKITDRIKTFGDACKYLGINPDNYKLNFEPGFGLNNLALATNAFIKLTIITRALNEDWKPDWNNSNERKYYPWFTMDSGRGFGLLDVAYHAGHSDVSGWLVYESEELCRYSATQFKDIWEIYMRYNKK